MLRQLSANLGTGKRFLVTYGKYGADVSVHIADESIHAFCFGYNDQTTL